MGEEIKYEKVSGLRLRFPGEADMEILRTMLNDPRIEYSVVGWGLPVAAAEQRNWFHEIYPHRNNSMYFIIEKEGTGIGCFILDKIDREMKTAEVGIKILRAHQGTKMTVEASRLFLNYCFSDLGLQCIYGYCLSLQRATLRLVRRLGFTEEGRQRCSVYKHGKMYDIIHFALTRQAYREREGI